MNLKFARVLKTKSKNKKNVIKMSHIMKKFLNIKQKSISSKEPTHPNVDVVEKMELTLDKMGE